MVDGSAATLRRPRRWELAAPPPADLVASLPDVHQLRLRLLYNRGYREPDMIRRHQEASFSELHDPFLMPAMATAVARLQVAASTGELVVVYGDFDADGVTGSAILERSLGSAGVRTESYIPKRLEEGYGLHAAAIEGLARKGAKVLITVDCGVTSIAEIELARSLGIDVIVCDHHKLPAELPPATALLHPGLNGYPFEHLCAAGVAFKLAQAVHIELGGIDPSLLTDFAAVGTLADMVPLSGENRVLVKHGLDKLRRDPSLGLSAMMDLAGIDAKRLTCSDVSFTLAPHINASGRLDDAALAYRLMVSSDDGEAADLATRLRVLNEERQRLTAEVLEQAREQVRSADPDQKAYVVAGEGWPPGVVGLVAGKLTEETGKPAFAMELGEDVCRGSARSVAGFDLVEAMTSCRQFLSRFGGHARAAGFTLARRLQPDFAREIVRIANVTLSQHTLEPVLHIDSELKMRHMNWEIFREVQRVGPFGMGNPTPTFLIRGLQPVDARSTSKDHLRLKFGHEHQVFDGIGFGLGSAVDWLSETPAVDVVFEMNSSRFHGFEALEMRVRDLRPSQVPG